MSYQEFPDWYQIKTSTSAAVVGNGKKIRKKKKQPNKKGVNRYSMLEKGNARYPLGMISNQVLPNWHSLGINMLRNIITL